MPYPSEHSARIKEPGQFSKFRRENDRFGPGIDVIWGIKDGKAEIQAIRFIASKHSVAEAKSWLSKHGHSAIKFEPATGGKNESLQEAVPTITAMASKAGKSSQEAERLWGEAKKSAAEEIGPEPKAEGPARDRFLQYTMGIFKKMLGLKEQNIFETIDHVRGIAMRKEGSIIRELREGKIDASFPRAVATATSRSFPGDTFRRIDVIDKNNRTIPIFGVSKERGVWTSDTHSGKTFKSLDDAKAFAMELYQKEWKESPKGGKVPPDASPTSEQTEEKELCKMCDQGNHERCQGNCGCGCQKKEEISKEVDSPVELIKAGDKVTILVHAGIGREGPEKKSKTGRAVMRGPAGWVLNMGGQHGTPGIAGPKNTVKILRGGKVIYDVPAMESSLGEAKDSDSAERFVERIRHVLYPDWPDMESSWSADTVDGVRDVLLDYDYAKRKGLKASSSAGKALERIRRVLYPDWPKTEAEWSADTVDGVRDVLLDYDHAKKQGGEKKESLGEAFDKEDYIRVLAALKELGGEASAAAIQAISRMPRIDVMFALDVMAKGGKKLTQVSGKPRSAEAVYKVVESSMDLSYLRGRGDLEYLREEGETSSGPRSLSDIASEISRDWKKVYFGAVPYLRAMRSLSSINDNYMMDDGRSIVSYFLANASQWRGEVAKRVKAELKAMLARKS